MNRLLFPAVFTLLLSSAAFASPSDGALMTSLRQSERIVNSLRLDKPAQARVFAIDGSEYTCTEALWMKARLQAAKEALALHNATDATRNIHAVVMMLKARGSTATA